MKTSITEHRKADSKYTNIVVPFISIMNICLKAQNSHFPAAPTTKATTHCSLSLSVIKSKTRPAYAEITQPLTPYPPTDPRIHCAVWDHSEDQPKETQEGQPYCCSTLVAAAAVWRCLGVSPLGRSPRRGQWGCGKARRSCLEHHVKLWGRRACCWVEGSNCCCLRTIKLFPITGKVYLRDGSGMMRMPRSPTSKASASRAVDLNRFGLGSFSMLGYTSD